MNWEAVAHQLDKRATELQSDITNHPEVSEIGIAIMVIVALRDAILHGLKELPK